MQIVQPRLVSNVKAQRQDGNTVTVLVEVVMVPRTMGDCSTAQFLNCSILGSGRWGILLDCRDGFDPQQQPD